MKVVFFSTSFHISYHFISHFIPYLILFHVSLHLTFHLISCFTSLHLISFHVSLHFSFTLILCFISYFSLFHFHSWKTIESKLRIEPELFASKSAPSDLPHLEYSLQNSCCHMLRVDLANAKSQFQHSRIEACSRQFDRISLHMDFCNGLSTVPFKKQREITAHTICLEWKF